ncbi:MAG TPA: hypothetical protein VF746_03155 [Longimicrobium sp.]|jgi:hypothetical protein
MKHVFVGPAHRVQLSVHAGAGDQKNKLFRVDALPRSAHRSTAYIHGDHLYRGASASEAWDAVLQLVPTAEAPAALRAELAAGRPELPLCPYCGTVVRAHHRQTQVRWPVGDPRAELRAAHAACAVDEVHVDSRFLST